jgi:2-polyprenyl-3-methyl-5-hydroxy-6-metoxy-1,4-benzoquinol methylase
MGWMIKRSHPDHQRQIIMKLIDKSIVDKKPKDALRDVFEIDNQLYKLESKLGKQYDNGLHPKHRIIAYHNFFAQHIESGQRVLDIGSGNGFLANHIASNVNDCIVKGIEIEQDRVDLASKSYRRSNLEFVCGDVLNIKYDESYDVVMMSNVLEHIKNRRDFLTSLKNRVKPKKWLIRVPQFNRDWRVPLKREVGAEWRLSKGHFVEYTSDDFKDELNSVGLMPVVLEYIWGELWSVVRNV